jgi:hypothetical protein
MRSYKELVDVLSRRNDGQRRAAYESLKNQRVLRASLLLYPVYLACGALIGFVLSHGIHATMRVGILGATGFVMSSGLFVDYIRTKKILNAVVVLSIREDDRRSSLVDDMPVANPKREETVHNGIISKI